MITIIKMELLKRYLYYLTAIGLAILWYFANGMQDDNYEPDPLSAFMGYTNYFLGVMGPLFSSMVCNDFDIRSGLKRYMHLPLSEKQLVAIPFLLPTVSMVSVFILSCFLCFIVVPGDKILIGLTEAVRLSITYQLVIVVVISTSLWFRSIYLKPVMSISWLIVLFFLFSHNITPKALHLHPQDWIKSLLEILCLFLLTFLYFKLPIAKIYNSEGFEPHA